MAARVLGQPELAMPATPGAYAPVGSIAGPVPGAAAGATPTSGGGAAPRLPWRADPNKYYFTPRSGGGGGGGARTAPPASADATAWPAFLATITDPTLSSEIDAYFAQPEGYREDYARQHPGVAEWLKGKSKEEITRLANMRFAFRYSQRKSGSSYSRGTTLRFYGRGGNRCHLDIGATTGNSSLGVVAGWWLCSLPACLG